jgi:hypothetical protein
VRHRFGFVLILLATFLLSSHFSVHATYISSSSTHSCASPIPQPVSGSPSPALSVAGKILINEVLTLPGSRWNCSEPPNVYSTTNDSWIELFNPQNQPYNLYTSHATIDSGPGTTPFYLPLGSSIAPHAYLILFPSTFSGSHIITNVRLLIEGITIDQVEIPTLHVDQSFARVPDGSNTWQITTSPTIDANNNILLPVVVTTPTASLPNKSASGSNNSSSTLVPATGTHTAWKNLQFPTPASIETPSSKPTTSYVTPSPTPMTDTWDTPHRFIITVIIIALAITLSWCWRLFTSS